MATAGEAARNWCAICGVTPPKPRSVTASQFCPYSVGVPISVTRLVPNTTAAATAATAMMLPARAERTGTAVLPRPGSKASRTPMLPGTNPVLVSSAASRDGRPRRDPGSATPSGPAARVAVRQATGLSTRSGSRAIMATPAPRMARLTSTPGAGSTALAGPIGISGEAATAMPSARIAPVTVTMASRAREIATRVPRVAPKARSTGNSAASRASCLVSSWLSTASAIRPASAAKAASATACGRAACSRAVTWSAWLITSIRPPVPGRLAVPLYLRARALAVAMNLVTGRAGHETDRGQGAVAERAGQSRWP